MNGGRHSCVGPGLSCYFLVGPTAAGKTAVAQFIAEQTGAAILSADSMLVYRGMDIGTAKPGPDMRGRVPYYGVDLVEPSVDFSAWNFREYALRVLCECREQRRDVIVVGGTGLYVKSLTHGLDNSAGADMELRRHWEKVVSAEGIVKLKEAAMSECPAGFARLKDQDNPRRLIRLLETDATNGRKGWECAGAGQTEPALVGLSMPVEALADRISERVETMYREGLVAELRSLLERYGALSGTALQAIGYAEAAGVVDGSLSEREAIERTTARTRRLAKKQRTWFRHQAVVEWVDVPREYEVAATARAVMALWERRGPARVCE